MTFFYNDTFSNQRNSKMEWIKRHKNKLLFTAVIATGLYGGGRYLMNVVKQSQDRGNAEHVGDTRLTEHYHSNHETALSAVVGVLPSLQNAVCSQLDSDTIMAQLKTKPANKVALWEDLKIVGFAQLVTGVYSSTLLAVFMKVQLSILSGYMVQDLHKSPGDQSTTPDVQKQYLALVEHLLQEGMHGLAEVVRQSSQTVLNGYSLKQQVTCEGVEQLIKDIRLETSSSAQLNNSPRSRRKPRSFLIQYVLPKETLLKQARTSIDLVSAIRDILESCEFSEVLDICLERSFSVLANSLAHTYHSATQSQSVLPLARVIPLVTDHTPQVFEIHQKPSIVQSVMDDKDLQILSQNIYEAFSQYID